jgi:hypothetical protein
MRELVDHDRDPFLGEFLPEVVERVVPALDARNSIVEVGGDLLDELLTLASFGFLCCEVVDVWPTSAELLEQRSLPDASTPVNDLQRVSRRVERALEGIEFVATIVESHSLDNDYCDNDL